MLHWYSKVTIIEKIKNIKDTIIVRRGSSNI